MTGEPADAEVGGGHELEARAAALEESGWGEPFTYFQPRNLAAWVYGLLVGLGIVAFGALMVEKGAFYGPALAVAAAFFAVYGAMFWWFAVRVDRYSGLPGILLVLAFLWGGFGASWLVASSANGALIALYTNWFGAVFESDWGAALAAPFSEETSKAAGIVLLLVLAPRLVRTAFDGLVLGGLVGLGFQVFENVVYAVGNAGAQFAANQVGNAMEVVYLRMATGLFSHFLFSAIFGAGLIWFLGTPGEPRQRARGVGLMLLAMLLHGVKDAVPALTAVVLGAGPSTAAIVITYVVVGIGTISAAVWVYHLAVVRERAIVRAVMGPEVTSGIITPPELVALAGTARQHRAYTQATDDPQERRRRRHRLAAAHELGGHLARLHGEHDDALRHAYAELARLRCAPLDPAAGMSPRTGPPG